MAKENPSKRNSNVVFYRVFTEFCLFWGFFFGVGLPSTTGRDLTGFSATITEFYRVFFSQLQKHSWRLLAIFF